MAEIKFEYLDNVFKDVALIRAIKNTLTKAFNKNPFDELGLNRTAALVADVVEKYLASKKLKHPFKVTVDMDDYLNILVSIRSKETK